MKFRLSIVFRLFTTAFALLLVSCSSIPSLQGNWVLAVGQTTYPVQISHLNDDELMLTSSLAEISGRYRVLKKKLTMVKANQPRISGIEFELNTSNNWVITNSPPAARLTIPLFGATLARQQ
jgi:hypothetical protein